MKIAYFGTGLLGSGFVRHQLDLGTTVHVWNRSPDKARALERDGAVFFADPIRAIAGVDRIHLTLADDASVDAVLEPLAGAVGAETYIVDHTTTAPTPTAARVAAWAGRGKHYVHAPVFMSPQHAREGAGWMLASCSQAEHDALEPALKTMTGTLLYLGHDSGRAAAFKLFGNLMGLALVSALADVNRLATSLGISTADAFRLFETFSPGAMLPARTTKIISNDVTPSFEIAMARKDVRLMIDEAGRHGVTLGVMPAVAAMLDEAIARGEGQLDMSAIARVEAAVR